VATAKPAEYPKNWGSMSPAERKAWIRVNRPPRSTPAALTVATVPPVPPRPVAAPVAPVTAETEDVPETECYHFTAEAEELGQIANGLAGEDVVRAILRALVNALKPDQNG